MEDFRDNYVKEELNPGEERGFGGEQYLVSSQNLDHLKIHLSRSQRQQKYLSS